MEYKWNWKPKNAPDAKVAVDCIEEIKTRRGGITPQILMIESKKKSSPLHSCFEWNDTVAAEKYREEQARCILKSLIVVVESEEDEDMFVRLYVAQSELGEEKGSGFISIRKIQADEERDFAYKQQLKRELNEIKGKIKSYKEFSEIVSAIEAAKI